MCGVVELHVHLLERCTFKLIVLRGTATDLVRDMGFTALLQQKSQLQDYSIGVGRFRILGGARLRILWVPREAKFQAGI